MLCTFTYIIWLTHVCDSNSRTTLASTKYLGISKANRMKQNPLQTLNAPMNPSPHTSRNLLTRISLFRIIITTIYTYGFLMVFSWYLLLADRRLKAAVTKVKKLFGLVAHDWKMSWWSCIAGENLENPVAGCEKYDDIQLTWKMREDWLTDKSLLSLVHAWNDSFIDICRLHIDCYLKLLARRVQLSRRMDQAALEVAASRQAAETAIAQVQCL